MRRFLLLSGSSRLIHYIPVALMLGFAVMTPSFARPDEAADASARTEAEMSTPDPLEGQRIVSIVFIRRDIFDLDRDETSSWPYRAANSVHMISTEQFIRSMLLFSEGDIYRRFEAEESGRLLRGLGIINPVEITAREVEGGVEIEVDTHDQWSLEIGAKFGLFGKRSDWAISVDEENLLGRGLFLSLKYRSDEERESWTYGVYDPNILGSRWQGKIQFRDASDGFERLASLEFPFYSLATRWAGGANWSDREERSYLYSESNSVVNGTRLATSFRIWGGLRLPGPRDMTRRMTLGYQYFDKSYQEWVFDENDAPYELPEPIEVSGPRIGFEQVVDRFVVLHGFRAWRSQEDVGLGPNVNLGLTVSLPAFGGDRRRYLFDAVGRQAWSFDGWLLLGDVELAGRFDGSQMRDALVTAQLAASQLGARGFQLRLRVVASHELDRDRQVTLGADTGLRGWDPDYFDGTGSALANLQWRARLREDVLQLFTLGMVFFVDAGYTWGARIGEPMDRVHGDIGVGLVADVTEVGLVKLLRLEVALPDDGSGYTFTITTRHLF